MRYRSIPAALVAASLLTSSALLAQEKDPAIARIIEQGIQKTQVMKFQDHLCNSIGARLTGSLAFDRAANWARDEFEKMGLDAKLWQWGSWRTGWDRGHWEGRVMEPFQMELKVATPAWTGATKGLVKGRLVRMPRDLGEIDEITKDGPVYLWGGIPPRSPLRRQLEPYQRSGKILGVVMSARASGIRTSYPNQIRVFGDKTSPIRRYENRVRLVEVVIRNDQAKKIEEALGGEKPVVVQFDLRNRFRKGPVKLYNVIADLKGSKYPDEHVIVCGHLDSWHQATGATDNGTGTCSTLEAARILTAAKIKPLRTIRFILWGGEEQGLMGSDMYVKRNRKAMANVSVVFNHDNGTNWASAITVTDKIAPLLASAAAAINTLPKPNPNFQGDTIFKVNSRPELALAGGGSDHGSFGKVLVPAFGWRLTGKRPYGYGWHSQWDTYDIVVPAFQRHNATTFALMAYTVAKLEEKLPREGLLKPQRGGRGRGRRFNMGNFFGAQFEGMKVTKVNDNGYAKNAGMKAGDTIQAVNGKPVKSATDIAGVLRGNRGGGRQGGGNRNRSRTITVTVDRSGEKVTLKGERPARGRR